MFRTLTRYHSLFLLAACGGSTADPPARSLTGNWGAAGRSFVWLALVERDGVVRGHGWVATGGALGVLVDGTISGGQVELMLRPRLRSGSYTLRGQFNGERLTGAVSSGALTPATVDLIRVDTVAEALGSFAIAGAVVAQDGAPAAFQVNEAELTLQLDTGLRTVAIVIPASRIALGVHPLRPFTPGGAYAILSNRQIDELNSFESTSGELRINALGGRALTGSFRIEAATPVSPRPAENGRVTITGNFSAACPASNLPCLRR